ALPSGAGFRVLQRYSAFGSAPAGLFSKVHVDLPLPRSSIQLARQFRKAGACGSPSRGSISMRFMYLVKHPGRSGNPTPELMEAMSKLADREIKAGRMLDCGGLMPVQTGAHVGSAGGELSVNDGPVVEAT